MFVSVTKFDPDEMKMCQLLDFVIFIFIWLVVTSCPSGTELTFNLQILETAQENQPSMSTNSLCTILL